MGLRVREIEEREARVGIRPIHLAVQSTSHILVRQIFRWPATGEVDAARHGQKRIAQRLGIQASHGIETPEQPVVRIRLEVGGQNPRAPAIGVRHEDRLVELLDRPPRVDKLRRQPVQQFRMRRALPELAEVAGRRHDAPAKAPLPQAVDEDAGRERVFGRHDGAGQFEPSAAPLEQVGRVSAQDREKTPRHGRAEVLSVAADCEPGVLRILRVAVGVEKRVGCRDRLLEPRKLGFLGLEMV